MKNKFFVFFFIVLLITMSIGISYASWVFSETQKDFNTLGSKCFELIMVNESKEITLEKAHPITDQEGLELTGYTFTIKNTCNTYATYEVNLEDIINEEVKPLPNEYIKVSINDGTPENLNKLEEKETTIENARFSYELTSGSLAPDSEVTYTVKLWLDEATPAIEEVMNASFESKVTIGARYIEEEELENTIQISYESITEEMNNQQEDFIIRGTSEKYNLIEYSIDNSHWSRIERQGKEVEIPYTFKEEGRYTFYIKDEVGNISSIEIETTKLDQSGPDVIFTASAAKNSIEVNASLSTDKSKIISYEFSQGNDIWQNNGTSKYTFTDLSDGVYTVHVRLIDSFGNITEKMQNVVIAYDNVYVSSSGSDASGDGSMANPLASISKAYNQVKDGGTIWLLSDVTENSTINLDETNKTITLTSGGEAPYSVYRNNEVVLINITAQNTLNLENITIDGGGVTTTEALVSVATSANLTINKNASILENGTQNGVGRAIGNFGGHVTINDGVVASNLTNAINGDGKLDIKGGYVYNNAAVDGYPVIYQYNNGIINISGGKIEGKGASPSLYIDGGSLNITAGEVISDVTAIYVRDYFNVPNINISDGTFISNMYLTFQNYGVATITGGTFISNDERTIYNYPNATLKIIDGTFTSESSLALDNDGTATITGGTFTSNGGNVIINYEDAKLTIDGTAIIKNTIESYPALYNYGTVEMKNGTISAENTNAIYNSTEGNLTVFNGNISSTNSIALNNYGTATITGGTLTSNGSNTIYNRTDATMKISGGRIIALNYRAIYNYGNLTLSNNAYLENNSASYTTIYNSSSAVYVNDSDTVVIKNLGGGRTVN